MSPRHTALLFLVVTFITLSARADKVAVPLAIPDSFEWLDAREEDDSGLLTIARAHNGAVIKVRSVTFEQEYTRERMARTLELQKESYSNDHTVRQAEVIEKRGQLWTCVSLGLSKEPSSIVVFILATPRDGRLLYVRFVGRQSIDAFIAKAVDQFIDLNSQSEPNQPPQRNAGSRPPSDDSPASETPSSLGPRG